MPTALAVVIGAAIVGLAIPLVLFENLLAAAGGMVLGAMHSDRLSGRSSAGGGCGSMRKHLPYALQAVADAVRSGQTLSEACELVSQGNQRPAGPGIRLCPLSSSSWATRRSA